MIKSADEVQRLEIMPSRIKETFQPADEELPGLAFDRLLGQIHSEKPIAAGVAAWSTHGMLPEATCADLVKTDLTTRLPSIFKSQKRRILRLTEAGSRGMTHQRPILGEAIQGE